MLRSPALKARFPLVPGHSWGLEEPARQVPPGLEGEQWMLGGPCNTCMLCALRRGRRLTEKEGADGMMHSAVRGRGGQPASLVPVPRGIPPQVSAAPPGLVRLCLWLACCAACWAEHFAAPACPRQRQGPGRRLQPLARSRPFFQLAAALDPQFPSLKPMYRPLCPIVLLSSNALNPRKLSMLFIV